ncbi:MAG: hypothetical protein ABIH76_03410 [Candidatus Bathyarchaeota archaeon]
MLKMNVLMVSSYPPMRCGIARYTGNLVKALKKLDINVQVACHFEGIGDFRILDFNSHHNSEILLKTVKEMNPDLVHVQYEPGLYHEGYIFTDLVPGSLHRPLPLSDFYRKCKVKIATTFHSIYVPTEFFRYSAKNCFSPRRILNTCLSWGIFSYLARNREIASLSSKVIQLSQTSANVLRKGTVIYHGAEPHPSVLLVKKEELRRKLKLPTEQRLAVITGFGHPSKGVADLKKIDIPENWRLVVNQHKHPRSNEPTKIVQLKNALYLDKGMLNDQEFSELLAACDVVLLSHQIASCSGTLFDGLANGLPFIAPNSAFFREFASKGLGKCFKTAKEIPKIMSELDEELNLFQKNVKDFREQIAWSTVARKHAALYEDINEG